MLKVDEGGRREVKSRRRMMKVVTVRRMFIFFYKEQNILRGETEAKKLPYAAPALLVAGINAQQR